MNNNFCKDCSNITSGDCGNHYNKTNPVEEWKSDLLPFKHGEEGTHEVCNKHAAQGRSYCCECSGLKDCSNKETNEGLENLIKSITDEYGQLHSEACALNLEGGSWEGCDCVIKGMIEEIVKVVATHASEERKALAEKVRDLRNNMTIRVVGNSSATLNQVVDQVLSMLETI